MEVIFSILILTLLTLISGYFSSTEVALFSLSSVKIKAYEKNSDPRKRLIAELVTQPRDLLVTVFMLNTVANILLQNVASHIFGVQASWTLTIGVPLVLTLIFGEVIPKYIGIQNNVAISYYSAPLIKWMQDGIKPLRKIIIQITLPISRILFFYLKPEKEISKEELQHVIKKTEEQGVLPREEAELVWGYLNLQDASVKELMRPREDMLYYSITEPLTKLVYLLVDQQCSRLPVCDQNNIQNILGIIDAKRFFTERNQIQSPRDIILFLDKPYYVPETALAKMLLRRLDEKNQELAIVVNEYGFITGLITYEDLVEVVVGNITDLRDQRPLYTKAGPNEIIASGKLELLEFNQIFNSELESDTMVTIGGWITEQIEDIPKTGSKWQLKGFLFHILAATPTHIRRIYIRQITPKHLLEEK